MKKFNGDTRMWWFKNRIGRIILWIIAFIIFGSIVYDQWIK